MRVDCGGGGGGLLWEMASRGVWLDAEVEGKMQGVRNPPSQSRVAALGAQEITRAWQTRGVSDHFAAFRTEREQVIPTAVAALHDTPHKKALAIGREPEIVVADVCIRGGGSDCSSPRTQASDAALSPCLCLVKCVRSSIKILIHQACESSTR